MTKTNQRFSEFWMRIGKEKYEKNTFRSKIDKRKYKGFMDGLRTGFKEGYEESEYNNRKSEQEIKDRLDTIGDRITQLEKEK